MANVDIRGGSEDPYINAELSVGEAAAISEWWQALTKHVDPYGFDKDVREEWTIVADVMADLGMAAYNA